MDLREVSSLSTNRHPWELARARTLLALLPNLPRTARYADVGSGDLYIARQLQTLTDLPVEVVDPGMGSVESGSRFIPHSRLSDLPREQFDVLLLLDVLEHVERDQDFLQEAVDRLKPGGTLLITVPAFQSLFSLHDVFLKHFRRYNRREVVHLATRAHLRIQQHFYFFTSLLVPRIAQKLSPRSSRKEEGIGRWPYPEDHWVTRWITAVLEGDFRLNQTLASRGIRMPGLSICLLCQKESV